MIETLAEVKVALEVLGIEKRLADLEQRPLATLERRATGGGIPSGRTIEIAGTSDQIDVSPTGAQDLSTDRSWTIGLADAVTSSLALADTSVQPGDNVSVLTNDAGYLTSAGAVTSITGTANQITASAPTGAVTLSLPSDVIIDSPGLATTTTQGLALRNATASTSGTTVQYSPAFDLEGHGWSTSLGGSDRYVRFRNEVQPVSGAVPYGLQVLKSSVDTGTASWTNHSVLVSSRPLIDQSVTDSTSSIYMKLNTLNAVTASGFGSSAGFTWLSFESAGTQRMRVDWSAGNAIRFYAPGRMDFESGGQVFFTGTQFFFQAHSSVNRVGDSSSVATQKDSYGLYFENALWNGSANVKHQMEIRAKASTSVSMDHSLVFFSHVTGGVGTDGTEAMRIYWQNATSLSFVGIGVTAPTATLHLKAGTTAANTAPLKLTTGTSMTTPEDGAFEFTNPTLYFTCNSAVRHEVVLDHPTGGSLITSGLVHGVEDTGTGHLTIRGGRGLSGKAPTNGSNTVVTAGAAGSAGTVGGGVSLYAGTDAGGGTGSVSIRQSDGTTDIIEVDETGLGFYGASPVAQQTGVGVDAASIHAALVNLGLITA